MTFLWSCQKNVVYLRSQFHAGDVCTSSAGVADIFKRRLLTLCSGVFETSQLSKASSGLSNDRCPTGYRLSLLCLFWYIVCVYACAQYLNWKIARRVFIFGVGFVLSFYQEGNARASISGTAIVGLHAF